MAHPFWCPVETNKHDTGPFIHCFLFPFFSSYEHSANKTLCILSPVSCILVCFVTYMCIHRHTHMPTCTSFHADTSSCYLAVFELQPIPQDYKFLARMEMILGKRYTWSHVSEHEIPNHEVGAMGWGEPCPTADNTEAAFCTREQMSLLSWAHAVLARLAKYTQEHNWVQRCGWPAVTLQLNFKQPFGCHVSSREFWTSWGWFKVDESVPKYSCSRCCSTVGCEPSCLSLFELLSTQG